MWPLPETNRPRKTPEQGCDRHRPRTIRLHVGHCEGSADPVCINRLSKNDDKTQRSSLENNYYKTSRAEAGTRPRFRENSRPTYGIRHSRTSVGRESQLPGENKSCGQTRAYQSDQTSNNRPRLWLCLGSILLTNLFKKGWGNCFLLDNCQPYQVG